MNNEPDYGHFTDYPTVKIGGGNPYHKCAFCGISDPQINGRLEGHADHCEWVKKKKAEFDVDTLKAQNAAMREAIERVLASYGDDFPHEVEWMALDWVGTGDFKTAAREEKRFVQSVIEPCRAALKL